MRSETRVKNPNTTAVNRDLPTESAAVPKRAVTDTTGFKRELPIESAAILQRAVVNKTAVKRKLLTEYQLLDAFELLLGMERDAYFSAALVRSRDGYLYG